MAVGEDKIVYNPDFERVRVGDLEELPGPYEILDPEAGEEVTFHIEKWEFGKMIIAPEWLPEPKWIGSLRVFTRFEDKPGRPPYWDLNPGRLQVQLFPILKRADVREVTIKVRSEGIRPRKIYFLEVIPASS